MSGVKARLSAEREAELRQRVAWGMGFPGCTAAVEELLTELDAVRAEREEAAARLEIAICSHADGQWMRIAIDKIRELDHIKAGDAWKAMCTAELERDTHLGQMIDIERSCERAMLAIAGKQREYCELARVAEESGLTDETAALSAAANALSWACDTLLAEQGASERAQPTGREGE